MVINPINIFQIATDAYRIKVKKCNWIITFSKDDWIELELAYNSRAHIFDIIRNGVLMHTFEDITLKLSPKITIGNGSFDRLWKGRVGYLSVFSIGDGGEQDEVYHFNKKNSGNYR